MFLGKRGAPVTTCKKCREKSARRNTRLDVKEKNAKNSRAYYAKMRDNDNVEVNASGSGDVQEHVSKQKCNNCVCWRELSVQAKSQKQNSSAGEEVVRGESLVAKVQRKGIGRVETDANVWVRF